MNVITEGSKSRCETNDGRLPAATFHRNFAGVLQGSEISGLNASRRESCSNYRGLPRSRSIGSLSSYMVENLGREISRVCPSLSCGPRQNSASNQKFSLHLVLAGAQLGGSLLSRKLYTRFRGVWYSSRWYVFACFYNTRNFGTCVDVLQMPIWKLRNNYRMRKLSLLFSLETYPFSWLE